MSKIVKKVNKFFENDKNWFKLEYDTHKDGAFILSNETGKFHGISSMKGVYAIRLVYSPYDRKIENEITYIGQSKVNIHSRLHRIPRYLKGSNTEGDRPHPITVAYFEHPQELPIMIMSKNEGNTMVIDNLEFCIIPEKKINKWAEKFKEANGSLEVLFNNDDPDSYFGGYLKKVEKSIEEKIDEVEKILIKELKPLVNKEGNFVSFRYDYKFSNGATVYC